MNSTLLHLMSRNWAWILFRGIVAILFGGLTAALAQDRAESDTPVAGGTPSVPPRPAFQFPVGTLAFPSGTARSVVTVAEAAPVSNGALPGGYTQAQIAEMINNPLGNLWLLFLQNDAVWYDGDALDLIDEDQKVFNTTELQPVFSTQLTQNWRWIFRPVIPIESFDLPDGFTVQTNDIGRPIGINVDFERETGLGDIVLLNGFGKNEWVKPPNVFGFGTTLMLDTATEDFLGTGKWSAGPAAVALHIDDRWIYGLIGQHWWSFAGDDDREDVNLTDIQYYLKYRLSSETSIGLAPDIRYNWENDAVTFPIGLGIDTIIKLGPVPTKIGIEFDYYVETPDEFGPEWQIRLIFAPIVPAPAWSKKPLFAGG